MNKRERTKILRTALKALSEEHLVNAYEWAANGWPIGVGLKFGCGGVFVAGGIP